MRQTKQQISKKTNKKTKISKKQFTPSVDTTLIMPPKLSRHLKYNDGSTVRNNPGGSFLVYSYRISDLYDPDPAILSGSVTGFKEIMQFYSYYRVLKSYVSITICNLQTFPLIYGGCYSQTNLAGVISTAADAINALESTFSSKQKLISGLGGMDRATLNMSLPCSRILGEPRQFKAESNYTGLGLATPTTPLWFSFIVVSTTGASLNNGYATATTLGFDAEFFGLINLRS